jgi:hypothetical protein
MIYSFFVQIYSGYGHSCSSYDCCGSSTPRYTSTLGCQYTYHKEDDDLYSNPYYFNELHDGLGDI